ncbi:rhomboid-related protein 2-like [Panonychus citri]|uniref:rhomboid-related protein 2-like n=1 Tax=Panonychus citri TaxID=50023 RepID=UPI00230718DC|nr:rhomboid-related protein 2-like [Panonychus citri]XP_053207443.1 rhomboid-related protein 2-like [Panonychus citri]
MVKGNRVGVDQDQDQVTVSLEMDRIWKPVFDKYDTDGNGRIPIGAFRRRIMEANERLEEDIPREVLDEIIERVEWDHDGYISYSEFISMVKSREMGAHRPRLHRLIRYAAIAVVPKSQRQSVIRRYIEEYNCSPPPLFLMLISIVEIAVFIYYCVKMKTFSATGPVPFDSSLIYDPYRRYEVWRYLTYALIHAGFFHLFFNLLVQLLLGIPLEMVHKWWRVGLVYLSGVLAGSLGSSLSDPKSYLAGASGGVYALIAAHLANVVINFNEMEFGVIRAVGLVAFGTIDVGVAMYNRYTQSEKTRTSYSAHFMGALAGFLVGVMALRNLKVKKWEKRLGIIALVLYVILMGFCISFNFGYSDYFPKPRK